MLKNNRKRSCAAAIAVILAALLTYSCFTTLTYDICTKNEHTDKKECSAYHIPLFIILYVGEFLEAHNGAMTAIATGFIAWFTFTLRSSTDKLWRISERTLTELEAPFLSIKIIESGLAKKHGEIGHDFQILSFSITNYGRTPASLIELVDKTKTVPMASWRVPEIHLDFRSRNTMPRGVLSPPGDESQPFTRNLFANHMNELAADPVLLKDNAIFFYGFVRYETIFNQRLDVSERVRRHFRMSASASSRRSHSDLSPCPKHRIPFREQAMAPHLSGRDEYRVMKAMAGKPGMAMGKERTRANGDCGVDRVNSVAEGGEETIEPVSQSAYARLLARGDSSDGRLNLDE